MLKYLFFGLFFLFTNINTSTSFEIENYDDKDTNVMLVKKVNKQKINNKTNKKQISNIKKVSVKEKVNGKITNVNNINASKQMSASATGNIDSETANAILVKSNNSSNNNTKLITNEAIKKSIKQKNNSNFNNKNKTKVKTSSSSKNKKVKDIVSYNGQTIEVDNNLCKFVDSNDVVNLKKTLSMMRYGYRYVNWRCENDTSLLLLAIEKDNYLSAKLLIEKGADINLQDKAGVSPLHWLARSDSENSMKLLKLLINANTNNSLNLNLKDLEGYTPLMRAVEFENDEIVEMLVKAGANVDIKNKYGKNAISLIKDKIAYLNKEGNLDKDRKVLNNDVCTKILRLLKNENR